MVQKWVLTFFCYLVLKGCELSRTTILLEGTQSFRPGAKILIRVLGAKTLKTMEQSLCFSNDDEIKGGHTAQ